MDGEVLVLTCLEDTTADEVIGRLSERGARVARLDPGRDFPAEVALAARYGDHPVWGTLSTRSREVDLSRVGAVYYRRPTPYLHGRAAPEVVRFSAEQARFGLGGVLASLPCQYVNHPWRISAAEHKPLQLATAHHAGFSVPETLITNCAHEARAFAAQTVVDPPPDIADACLTYLKNLDLVFGAFDFVLTAEGRWVFLEANPNGQWAWLQDVTGLPIASAIADLLLEGP